MCIYIPLLNLSQHRFIFYLYGHAQACGGANLQLAWIKIAFPSTHLSGFSLLWWGQRSLVISLYLPSCRRMVLLVKSAKIQSREFSWVTLVFTHSLTFVDCSRNWAVMYLNNNIQSKWNLPPQIDTSQSTYGTSRAPHVPAGVIGRRPLFVGDL